MRGRWRDARPKCVIPNVLHAALRRGRRAAERARGNRNCGTTHLVAGVPVLADEGEPVGRQVELGVPGAGVAAGEVGEATHTVGADRLEEVDARGGVADGDPFLPNGAAAEEAGGPGPTGDRHLAEELVEVDAGAEEHPGDATGGVQFPAAGEQAALVRF